MTDPLDLLDLFDQPAEADFPDEDSAWAWVAVQVYGHPGARRLAHADDPGEIDEYLELATASAPGSFDAHVTIAGRDVLIGCDHEKAGSS